MKYIMEFSCTWLANSPIKTTAKIEGQTDVTKMKIVREGDAEPYAYKLYAQ